MSGPRAGDPAPAWQSLPNFEGKASPATWFYRVALQTAMNWHRKDKPRRSRQQPLLEVQAVVTEGCDSGEQAQQRETVEQLYNAIHQLPKTDAALVLLYLDELSYREMADVLGISESNVGVKLNRAKKALSALMNERTKWTLTVIKKPGTPSRRRRASRSPADLLLKEVQRSQRSFRATIFHRDFREVAIGLLMLPLWFFLGSLAVSALDLVPGSSGDHVGDPVHPGGSNPPQAAAE